MILAKDVLAVTRECILPLALRPASYIIAGGNIALRSVQIFMYISVHITEDLLGKAWLIHQLQKKYVAKNRMQLSDNHTKIVINSSIRKMLPASNWHIHPA
jgi:hypothetical protein